MSANGRWDFNSAFKGLMIKLVPRSKHQLLYKNQTTEAVNGHTSK